MKNFYWIPITVISLIALAVILGNSNIQSTPNTADKENIIVYMSPTCGCCDVYARYLRRQGYPVEIVKQRNMNEVKAVYGVPQNLESCHTSVVNNYIVEGHIPIEAIEQLLGKKPDIAGIALAGMPTGSPGMPGIKRAPFFIHAIGHSGEDLGIFVEL